LDLAIDHRHFDRRERETEHQTVCDTTTGMPKPMGARGATMQSFGFITVGLAARDKLPTAYYRRHFRRHFVSDGGLQV
jgi:hypothetical protein